MSKGYKEYYAHSLEDRPPSEWQPLEEHLKNVAEMSRSFAEAFGAGAWGYLAGLWHDLGKYHCEFQERIRGESVAVEHSGVGARLAFELDQNTGLPLAFVIAGHHTGLPNLQKMEIGLPTSLIERVRNNEKPLDTCKDNIPESILDIPLPALPSFLASKHTPSREEGERLLLMREMWVRFLFSCLVDADRLDTEAFVTVGKQEKRGGYDSIAMLRKRCDESIDSKIAWLSPEQKKIRVNRVRLDILLQCRKAALHPPGIFALTAPTGCGKTLSAMSFALNHAEENHLQRVIVVIPYTSIIEQNARVYCECLGAKNVLEHHSNLDSEKKRHEQGVELMEKHRLAAENWDAPVIVTTSVQFFETLFTAKPSRARRLHNIARSVIILDEVQTLPPGLLNPILDAINQLVQAYGCSVVLSTATPPALAAPKPFSQGLLNVHPIISDAETIARQLRRVVVKWPASDVGPLGIEELALQLCDHELVLCIVHRRRDARELAQFLVEKTGEPVFHLSALMCPAHRLQVIEEIGRRLKKSGPCRVVSTQLIEAGVDLDFPVVYRALCGLDSIIQAAGRCNREGLLDQGRVFVYESASKPPVGVPRKAFDIIKSLLMENGWEIDPDDPANVEHYFQLLYSNCSLDEKSIQPNRREFNFATVDRDFKLIEDAFSYTVIVPWGDGQKRLDNLRLALEIELPKREQLRLLQPFTVNIYEQSFLKLKEAGALEEIIEGIYALSTTHQYLYSEEYGLIEGDEAPGADPESLIV